MEKYLLEILSRESEEEASILGGEMLNRKIYSAGVDFVVNEARLFGQGKSISARTHTRYVDFPSHSKVDVSHNVVDECLALRCHNDSVYAFCSHPALDRLLHVSAVEDAV